MALNLKKYSVEHKKLLRDTRPAGVRFGDWLREPSNSPGVFAGIILLMWFPDIQAWADLMFLSAGLLFWWLYRQDRSIVFKMPMGAGYKDKHNSGPGRNERPEGILYLGNDKDTGQEVWFTNSDARTHILYLGTTGSGKTEGLKSMVSNALCWGSGFVYIDGKADTDLWSSLSSMVRRFGRDDDLFIINYMTGNSDIKAPSNTMNPFSSGSASYLVNMLVSLMPDASGDNVMWKERAVSMIGSVMPALTWKRDHQDIPMSIGTIRHYLGLNSIIRLSRDDVLPPAIRSGIRGYLDTLPGYVDAVFDDNGQVKPPGPDVPNVDTSTAFTQHGYLSMQLTRALQSLGDDYGYIFDAAAADVDMVDVVLNRRILVVLIPALEKSSDETANLGKIVAATIKGMMGSTLGSTVEGDSSTVIENKPTHSATPFMTVFDEVGYYTTQGMAVMAAQARSLGFSLVFAAQDLPALEKRVKEEARSITANCNLKIFGKLEDPTQTKDFFEKTVGSSFVAEVSGFQTTLGSLSKNYYDSASAGVTTRAHASYDGVRAFKEGEAVMCFGDATVDVKVYFCNPGHAKAMRVARFMMLPPPSEAMLKHSGEIAKLRDLMVKKGWTAAKADVAVTTPEEIRGALDGFSAGAKYYGTPVDAAMMAVVGVYASVHPVDFEEEPVPTQVASVSAVSPVLSPPVVSEPVVAPVESPLRAVPAAQASEKTILARTSSPAATGSSPFSSFVKPGVEETEPTQMSEGSAEGSIGAAGGLEAPLADVIRKTAADLRKKLIQSEDGEGAAE